MHVVEERTYNFVEDFSRVYMWINREPDQSIDPGRTEPYVLKQFSVCEKSGGCYRPLQGTEIVGADDSRPANTYYVRESAQQYYISWFHRSRDESKTFVLEYDVVNAITRQGDVEELYWQWIGDEWESAQSNVRVTLTLPPGIPGDQIQAWAHGGVGTVSIPDAQTVSFVTPYIPIGTFFEGRVIFPTEILQSVQVEGTNDKDIIIAQEQDFINATIRQKESARRKAALLGWINIVALVGSIALFIKQLKHFWKWGKDLPLPKVNDAGTLWEPPSNIDPAQIPQLMSIQKALGPEAFTATVLDLVQHKVYTLLRSDEKEGWLFKEYKYYLEDSARLPASLSKIQPSHQG